MLSTFRGLCIMFRVPSSWFCCGGKRNRRSQFWYSPMMFAWSNAADPATYYGPVALRLVLLHLWFRDDVSKISVLLLLLFLFVLFFPRASGCTAWVVVTDCVHEASWGLPYCADQTYTFWCVRASLRAGLVNGQFLCLICLFVFLL